MHRVLQLEPTCRYKLMNQISEYWYIGSMFASPEMQKKRIDECIATGLYRSLVLSISCSVAAAISCLAEISSERTLDDDKTLMAVSSSRIFPCELQCKYKSPSTTFLTSQCCYYSVWPTAVHIETQLTTNIFRKLSLGHFPTPPLA